MSDLTHVYRLRNKSDGALVEGGRIFKRKSDLTQYLVRHYKNAQSVNANVSVEDCELRVVSTFSVKEADNG